MIEPASQLGVCPRCKRPLIELRAEGDQSYFVDLEKPWLEDAIAVACLSCRIAAARVDRVEDVWRDECVNLIDVLAQDYADGLRDRRMWEDDGFDPLWTRIT